jgi:outer membrane protein
MKRILLTVVMAGLVFLNLRGQDQPKVTVKDSASVSAKGQPKMTLQECIKTALDNNLTVKRGVYNVESYKINLFQAWGAFLPTFSLNASYGRNYGRNLNPVTYTYFQGVTKTLNPSATAQLTLFNGLRIQNNLQATKKNVEASNLDLEKAKNDVIINVATYYVTVILNRELFENSKVQLTSSQQQLEKIKRQVEVGALPKSNELNQEAIVATNETTMINNENTLNISLLQLKQAMQVPASTPLDVVIPDLSVEDMIIDQTPEEIYAVSSQTLPQVKSALLKVESADFAVKAARGAYSPRLTLSASANSNYSSASNIPRTRLGDPILTTDPAGVSASGDPVFLYYQPRVVYANSYDAPSQLKDNVYKSVGLNLNIPILNGFQTRGNVENAIINRELANITVKETENTLRQSIETAYNNALAAAKTYVASLKQVNASEEAYRMTKLRLDNGAANFVEFQISANDLFSAKSSLSRAKYSFILTKKIIDFYQGKTIDY